MNATKRIGQRVLQGLYGIGLALGLASAHAVPTAEWASTVIDFSTQWSSGSWSAAQALGAPDTFSYGDIATAWAPGPKNGTLEFITVGFATPTYASSALIRETYGNGFVYQIDALDTAGAYHTVWSGTDNSQPGAPVDFVASWSPTAYKVAGLRVRTNTDHNLGAWEEVDAIQLNGDSVAAVPEPATFGLWLGGLGTLGLFLRRRRG